MARTPQLKPSENPIPTSRDDASCIQHKDLEPDAWFGNPNSSDGINARTTCLVDCPARKKCLTYVMGLDEQPPGLFAGLTRPERERLYPRWHARNSPNGNGRTA